jgi:prephenate dehydratase
VPVIAYLGPEGTFTHQAARDLSSESDALRPLASASEVIAAVEGGTVDGGVVAFENSLQGAVPANLDDLLDARSCLLAGERVLPVSFSLFRLPGDEEPLQGVVSHPFGLAQCRDFIRAKGLATREAASTAAACAELARDREPGWGALAPQIAGELAGLEPAQQALEDSERAATRFVLLRQRSPGPSGRDRSAFAFRPRQDEPGSLVRLLQEFSVRDINLTAIKSRPTKVLLGEYVFFIECEGHIADPRLRDAVRGLLRFPGETRFLGSFPEDPQRPPRNGGQAEHELDAAYRDMLGHVDSS